MREQERERGRKRRNPPQVTHEEQYESFMHFLEIPLGAILPAEADDRD